MELENVNRQSQEQPFSFNFLLPAGEESAEIHILFSKCESTFRLNGTIDSEQDTFIGVGGKVILPSLGKDFFTSVGKQFFT